VLGKLGKAGIGRGDFRKETSEGSMKEERNKDNAGTQRALRFAEMA
jgi:hypothetical protein